MIRAIASDSSVFRTLINEWYFHPVTSFLGTPSGSRGLEYTGASPPLRLSRSDLAELHRHIPASSASCVVDLYVGFEFQHAIYATVSGLFLDEVGKMMVTAFDRRARTIYGPPARPSLKLSSTSL
eukprot:jgi/Hompol1/5012/HPOL_000674-RA